MAIVSKTPLVFKVTRSAPVLIPPTAPTPIEYKYVSDIDDQEWLRFQLPAVLIFKNNNNNNNKNNNKEHRSGSGSRTHDPAKVMKEAIGKALVPYYPLAGRLTEVFGRKLVVNCTGEGVLFVEAHADVTLDQFGEELQPPFPCMEELRFDLPGSSGILHTPLMYIQMTKLRCGGLILALRYNHVMADGTGMFQFLRALAEFANGAEKLSVDPVWDRHLLSAREIPHVTFPHPEYDELVDNDCMLTHDLVHKSFFFGAQEISALRRLLPPHLKASTTNDVLTACIWRCRTVALQLDLTDEVRFITILNARSAYNPPLPEGYYGNALAFPPAITTAGQLCRNPVGYAVELLQKSKADVSHEYMMSLADLMHTKGRPCLVTGGRSFIISNLAHITRFGLDHVDYGWGLPLYCGPPGDLPSVTSFYVSSKNKKGERGILFPLCLPTLVMERFTKEMSLMLDPNFNYGFISSSL